MKVSIASINKDTTIQCRAKIDIGVVNAYAQDISEGATFPPVELFGTEKESWIGDGWHRISAFESIGEDHIEANIHSGGRVDALKYALSANSIHGHRRSNEDKRRCIEIALSEFPDLSSRQLGQLCGVDHKTVESVRDQLGNFPSSKSHNTKRKCADGKVRTATPKKRQQKQYPESEVHNTKSNGDTKQNGKKHTPPCIGRQLAYLAIAQLEEVAPDDLEREQAFQLVREWLDEHQTK